VTNSSKSHGIQRAFQPSVGCNHGIPAGKLDYSTAEQVIKTLENLQGIMLY